MLCFPPLLNLAGMSVCFGAGRCGPKRQTADVIAFSRTKRIYGGISVEGSAIKTRVSLSNGYCGKAARIVDIVIRRAVEKTHSF